MSLAPGDLDAGTLEMADFEASLDKQVKCTAYADHDAPAVVRWTAKCAAGHTILHLLCETHINILRAYWEADGLEHMDKQRIVAVSEKPL